MTKAKAIIDGYFEKIDQLGWDPGLRSVKELLARLGNPQNDCKVIHIAGTNGKGSTLAYLASILQEAGLKVGRFTSPELMARNEMISVNGKNISDDEMVLLLEKVEAVCDEMVVAGFRHPTSFEVMTALAYCYFAARVDLALIETGMGGRLDATNVVEKPLLVLMSPIGLDHQAFLGESVSAITKEKTGIFRFSVPVISAPQTLEARTVLIQEAHKLHAQVKFVEEAALSIKKEGNALHFRYKGKSFSSSILGRHQGVNAAVAIEAARALIELGWELSENHIAKGIQDAHWAGRFEILRETPLLVVDGAHNVQGMNALNQTRKRVFAKGYLAVVGVLGDKEMGPGFVEILKDAEGIWTATPNSPRALNAMELSNRLRSLGLASQPKADLSDLAQAIVQLDQPCLIFGSLYLIGFLRTAIKEKL